MDPPLDTDWREEVEEEVEGVRFIVRVNNGAGTCVAEGFHAYLLRCRPPAG